MNNYNYILEPYRGMNTRYHCPRCQQREKTFSRYIDTKTREYIAPTVGRCNRESNCGYHYTPKQYFQDNNIPYEGPQTNLRTGLIRIVQPKRAGLNTDQRFIEQSKRKAESRKRTC